MSVIYTKNLEGEKTIEKCSVRVDHYDFFRLMYKLAREEGNEVSISELESYWLKAYRQANSNPSAFREDRHTLISNHDTGSVIQKDSVLLELYNRFGYRSIITNTYARAVSLIRLNMNQVKIATKGYIPPAFDRGLPYPSSKVPEIHNAYKYLSRWSDIPGLRDIIIKLRTVRNKYYKKYAETGDRRLILLDNNSSQGYSIGTVNITDTMANVYCCNPIVDKLTGQETYFNHLSRLVGLANTRSDDDKFSYIPITDQFEDYKFRVVAIPDKDGKIRFIFQGCADVQTISKALHELFDTAARDLPGNYTYDHKGWFRTLEENGWFRTKYIICTDMSKYSDTLHRRFILEILKEAGFTEDEIRELDILFSLPVKNLDGTVMGNDLSNMTLASYQGQYGDFPLITIANLVVQAIIKYILREEFSHAKNAAVGDDTGFVFDRYYANAYEVIRDVYGSVGVRINRLKTGELIMGNGGVVDFVKLRADKDGLIPFIEPKPYFKDDFDQAIRDIYDSLFWSDNKKQDIFNTIFDDRVASHLMDISIINGGINLREIEERDVNDMLYRKIQLSDFANIKYGSFYTWINQTTKLLNASNKGWRDTVFYELKGIKEYDSELKEEYFSGNLSYEEYNRLLEGKIMLEMSKVGEIGSKYSVSDYRKLVGLHPSDIYNNHRMKQQKRNYNKDLEDMYMLIKENDSWLGRLKRSNVKASRKVYKDKIEADMNGISQGSLINIDSSIRKLLFMPEDMSDFTDNLVECAKSRNAYIVVESLIQHGHIVKRSNGFGTYYYFINGDGTQYALFRSHVHSSKYPIMPDALFETIPSFSSFNSWEDLMLHYEQIGR